MKFNLFLSFLGEEDEEFDEEDGEEDEEGAVRIILSLFVLNKILFHAKRKHLVWNEWSFERLFVNVHTSDLCVPFEQ